MENKTLENITVIIPAYKPGESMLGFLQELSGKNFEHILLINDGSGSEFDDIFKKSGEIAGVEYIAHAVNMGKGRALKTSINHYLTTCTPTSMGIVTADADGQHLVKDIVRVAEKLLETKDTMILGSRTFSEDIPFKSKWGNTITRWVYRFASGMKISDTQTGLRGMPKDCLPHLIRLNGERYEYEMSMLLELKSLELDVIEIPIETVYIDNNSESHFNPFVDSWKIYKLIISFIGSSLFAAVIDITMYSYFFYVVFDKNLLVSVVLARIISSFVNFLINRKVLLAKNDDNQSIYKHMAKYYSLAVVILAASYGLTYLLSVVVGINPVVAKLICDIFLFLTSFAVQKRVIFK